jgi:hypothetical protein
VAASNLNIREQQIADHLKTFRPKMYQELVRTGQLEPTVKQMWAEYTDQLHELTVVKKLPFNQAQELLLDLIRPPSEQDQPHLGENPGTDPTSRTTTR